MCVHYQGRTFSPPARLESALAEEPCLPSKNSIESASPEAPRSLSWPSAASSLPAGRSPVHLVERAERRPAVRGSGGAAASGGASSTGGASPAVRRALGGATGSGGGFGTGGAASSGAGNGSGGAGTGGALGTGGDLTGSGGNGSGGGSGDTTSAGCDTERTLMNGRRTIQTGGMNREYILRVPDNYDNTKPYRLIMAYHWLNGNASQVANGGEGGSTEDPYYGLWDLAENSTIFVAPEGIDVGWWNDDNRDVIFTDDLLEALQEDLCIDKTRIFSTGFSFGGGMSYALACARADVFRGVAIYAGGQLSGCEGGNTPIAYFHAHGANDTTLNISGGRQMRDRYVDVNGCTDQDPPEPAINSGQHTCTSYAGCSEGYPVRWCAHGGGHNPTEKDSGQNDSWVPGEAWGVHSRSSERSGGHTSGRGPTRRAGDGMRGRLSAAAPATSLEGLALGKRRSIERPSIRACPLSTSCAAVCRSSCSRAWRLAATSRSTTTAAPRRRAERAEVAKRPVVARKATSPTSRKATSPRATSRATSPTNRARTKPKGDKPKGDKPKGEKPDKPKDDKPGTDKPGDKPKDPKPPAGDKDPPKPAEPLPPDGMSRLSVPLRAPFEELVERVDALLPKTQSQDWQRMGKDGDSTVLDVKYKMWRDPIEAKFKGRTLTIIVPVRYAADIKGKVKNPFGSDYSAAQ